MRTHQVVIEYELTNASSGPCKVRRAAGYVSLRGATLHTDKKLPPTHRVVIRFQLPHHRIIAVCRVVKRSPRRIYLEYLTLDSYDREQLALYVQA